MSNFSPSINTYDLGDQTSVTFTYVKDLVMKYTSGLRTSDVTCVCGNKESFSFVEENPKNTYVRYEHKLIYICSLGRE